MLTVTRRLDRLARSTRDLLAIVKQIVDADAQFRSLAEPWADTATSTGRLMLAVLGGLADVERDLILETLKHCLGNRTHAANILGISIRTLRNKLNEYADGGVPIPPPGAGEYGQRMATAG